MANIIFFIALIFVFDWALGNVLRHFYFMTKSGDQYHLNYSLDSTKAEIIILGSSRAHNHYVSEIIEDSLKLTCFNTGMDGIYIQHSYAICRSIIKRYTPRIVLMEIIPGELFVNTVVYDRLRNLLPYYKENKEIRSVVNLKNRFIRLKLNSKIYPFNSSLLEIGYGILKTEDINELKGYKPLFSNLPDTTITHSVEYDDEIDNNTLVVLHALASDCDARHIKLIFIQSPRYTKVSQEKSISIINELTKKYDVEFWNYVNDTNFLKPEYFKDTYHMNDFGAHEFSKVIASTIKKRYGL
jgi:hypothetical protein